MTDAPDEPSGRARGFEQRWAPAALVFCTSAAVLIIEILAGRLVAPYVGVSLETYTGIIGTVLAGIAVGTAVGGRIADQRDPRPLIGPLLLASGAAAIVALPVIATLGPSIAASGGGPGGIVVLAVTAFVLPTALLSAVSPMVAKVRLTSTSETGTVVGGLSAAGTAGALVGTFGTGFVLVAALPTRPILLGVGVALIVSGVVVGVRLGHRPAAPLVLAPLVLGGLAATIPSPCEQETRYYCVAVVPEDDPARPGGRLLVLDDLRHGYVDLDDPTHLEFRYVQQFARVVDEAAPAGPLDALHLGGGAFTVPAWLAATRPGSSGTVLELDPGIVDIASAELGLDLDDPSLDIRTGDARTNLADLPTDAFDVVVGDVFGGVAPPWHLLTVETVAEIDRAMREDGVYVLNVIDAGPRDLVRAKLATLGARFEHLALVGPAFVASGNHVLVASHQPLVLAPIDARDGTLVTGAELDEFVGDAQVLRDDFAPVEQLLTRP